MPSPLTRARLKAQKRQTTKGSRVEDQLRRWLTMTMKITDWESISIDETTRVFEVELYEGLIPGVDMTDLYDELLSSPSRRDQLDQLEKRRLDKDGIRKLFIDALGEKNVYRVTYSQMARAGYERPEEKQRFDRDGNPLPSKKPKSPLEKMKDPASGNIVMVTGYLPIDAKSIRSTGSRGAKMFNLMWVNEQMGAIMAELATEGKREPEIAAALSCMLAAKQLFTAYEERLGDTAFRSIEDDTTKDIREGDVVSPDELEGHARILRGGGGNDKLMAEIEDSIDKDGYPNTRSTNDLRIEIQQAVDDWRRSGNAGDRGVVARVLIDQLAELAGYVKDAGDDRVREERRFRSVQANASKSSDVFGTFTNAVARRRSTQRLAD